MNLIHLRYFVELAHTHHYLRAAEKLCITQPSLSYAISQLEVEMGVPLFDKNRRNAQLTCFGEEFLQYVEKALQILDDGVDALKKGANGEGVIRLGMIRPAGVDFVPDLAIRFLKENPDRDIRFTFSTGITQDLVRGLQDQHYDLVFSSNPKMDLGMQCDIVCQQEMVLIVSAEHPLASFDSIRLEQTMDYPYVYFSKESSLRYEVDSMFEELKMNPKIAYEILEDEVVAGVAAKNFGIAVVPESCILSNLNLKVIRIENPIRTRNVYMVSNKWGYMSPVVKDFQKFVLQNVNCENSRHLSVLSQAGE